MNGRDESFPAQSIGSTSLKARVYLRLKRNWRGSINPLSIVYADRLRLRSRLTLGRTSLPRKPWVYGGVVFHHPDRYLCLHPHFMQLHVSLPSRFDAAGTLLYHTTSLRLRIQSFGMTLIANYFRRMISR
jgi:hypothetical protein